jgi:hypothetical protein
MEASVSRLSCRRRSYLSGTEGMRQGWYQFIPGDHCLYPEESVTLCQCDLIADLKSQSLSWNQFEPDDT